MFRRSRSSVRCELRLTTETSHFVHALHIVAAKNETVDMNSK